MADKNFIDGQTVIEASDANSWEELKDKHKALTEEVAKKMYSAGNTQTAGDVLMAESDLITKWKPLPKASKVDEIALANIGTVGDTYSKEELQKIADLLNKNKETLNALIQALKTANIMANN